MPQGLTRRRLPLPAASVSGVKNIRLGNPPTQLPPESFELLKSRGAFAHLLHRQKPGYRGPTTGDHNLLTAFDAGKKFGKMGLCLEGAYRSHR